MASQYYPIKKIPFICCYANPIGIPGNYHNEMEVLYVTRGQLNILVDSKLHHVKEGQAIVIASGIEHERLTPEIPTSVIFTKFGTSLLGEFFSELSCLDFPEPVFDIDDASFPSDIRPCFDVFKTFSEEYGGNEGISYHDWMVKSSMLRLATFFLEDFPHVPRVSLGRTDKKLNFRIQSAISFIEDNYRKSISIESVATKLGYEKTYFCKIFKEATGTSFHKFLNIYRVNAAKSILRATQQPIGEVAISCGFVQFKTFCKVFKDQTGLTPTEYRERKAP